MRVKFSFQLGLVFLNLILLTPFPLCGQGVLDSLFFSEMDSLYYNQQGEQAIQLTTEAQQRFKLAGEWESYINCFNQIARYLENDPNLDERKKVLHQAVTEGGNYLGTGHSLMGSVYQQKGELFIQLSELDSANVYLDKAISIFAKNHELESQCWALIVKGVGFYQYGRFKESESVLLGALSIVEAHPEIYVLVPNTIFQILAAIYTQTGAYDKSLESALLAVEISLSRPNNLHSDTVRLANQYNILGNIYVGRHDYDKAIRNFKIALNLGLKAQIAPSDILRYYIHIGNGFRRMGQYEEAQTYFLNSLSVLQNNPTTCTYKDTIKTQIFLAANQLALGNPQESILALLDFYPLIQTHKYLEIDYFFNLGKAYADNGELEKAIFYYKKAENSSPLQTNNYHEVYAKTLQQLGKNYALLDSLGLALEFLQQALTHIKPSFIPSSAFSNPTLIDFSAYELLLHILVIKAQVLEKMYTGELDSLKKILPTYELAFQVIDRIRHTQDSEASKLLLSTKARDIYDGAIGLLFQLYQASGDAQYLQTAFGYMEKSKSLVLLEGVREYKALQTQTESEFGTDSVFQALLQQEKQLNLDRVFYEQKLAEAERAKDSLKMNTLRNTLAKVYENQQILQRRFEKQYPAYHQVNFTDEVVTIEEVQQTITTDHSTALLEYYLASDAIYVIRILHDQVDFYRLDYPDDFAQMILAYRTSVGERDAYASEKDQFQAFTQSAYQLYKALLEPAIGNFPQAVQHLYVITDGEMGYISMESLLASLPSTDEVNFSAAHLDYIVEKWAISYGYSCTLLRENGQKGAAKRRLKPYGGFAPVYDQNRVTAERSCESGQPLGALPATEASVQQLQALLGGKHYLRANASKENFLTDAAKFQILHLSTHACVDDENPLFNRIFFANEYLPTYEVYNMHLNANLVVLSACETGFGELSKGEGIMSLARSFMYAGSQSVVTSLWNANDQATTQIMIDFHTYLHEGLSKAAALHQAKLDYLAKAPSRRSSPYYWSNFVLIGDTQAIAFDGFPWGYVWWMVIGFGVIALVIYWFLKRKKGK